MTLAMGVVAIDIVLLKMVLRCPNISQCCTFSTLATIPRITATMKGAVTMRLASGRKATSWLVCLVMSAGTRPKFMSIPATSKGQKELFIDYCEVGNNLSLITIKSLTVLLWCGKAFSL